MGSFSALVFLLEADPRLFLTLSPPAPHTRMRQSASNKNISIISAFTNPGIMLKNAGYWEENPPHPDAQNNAPPTEDAPEFLFSSHGRTGCLQRETDPPNLQAVMSISCYEVSCMFGLFIPVHFEV